MTRGRKALLLAAAVLAAGCGRKLPPLPPILEVPETTTDLWAYQDNDEIVLTWSYPQLTRAGTPLTDLTRIEVWRLEVPPGQEQVGEGPAGGELRQTLMLSRGKLVARLEAASLQAATRGSSLTYREKLPEVAPGSTPPFLWYAVRSRRKDGTASALSNIVNWQVNPVPPTPTGFVATPLEGGITLTWDPVAGATYVVERQAANNAPWEIASKIGIDKPEFMDAAAQQGQVWGYRVRSLAKMTVSPPAGPVEVPYPDIYPPAPVANFICLPEPGLVRLRWEASPEPTVTYKIFRRQGDAAWDHLQEAFAGTEYTDASPPSGEVEYAVKAVDAAGNQSKAVYCKARTGT